MSHKRHDYAEDKLFSDTMPFGEFMCKKRRLLGMCQQEFSDVLGFSHSAICSWEMGKTSPPIELARDIIESLGGELLIVNRSEGRLSGYSEKDEE